jgi:glycosyltransferase involved in cell wall biosynthesis
VPTARLSPPESVGHALSAKTDLSIAFVGTFPPRRCGIATFTRDLSEAVESASNCVAPVTIALTDPGGKYEYPEPVKYEIRQGIKADYARAAEFASHTGVNLVSLQHEYGIFGGDDGAYVLDFLTALRVPALITLHTVLKRPSTSQKAIVRRMSNLCAGFVVMSQVAADLLDTVYEIPTRKVHIIPHGIPKMEPCDRQALKARFGIAGRRMLLTFGLLSPNKGIEVAIRALPALIERFPDLVYFIVGATHPHVVRTHGESYRTSLEREAERLGMREQVVFRDQFITNEELCSYLQATDVFVSPYQNEAQVTSGALAYAMGAGAAVVSTPYWHAQELLSEGRGRLFPFGDSDALAETIASLLGSSAELEQVRASAYQYTRDFVWSRVGDAYLELGRSLARSAPASRRRRDTNGAGSLPELRIDHLVRMTDDTGLIQHATFSLPARSTGYCVDDNARALIVALEADRLASTPETKRLVTTYASFLLHAQTDDGRFRNLMSYQRTFESTPALDDCVGRALWALGTSVRLMPDDSGRRLARQMLERALPHTRELGPRGTALCTIGLANLLGVEPTADWAEGADRNGGEAGRSLSG